MNKLYYKLAGMFIIAVLFSCEKEKMDNQWNSQSKFNKSSVYIKYVSGNIESYPISFNKVTPYIIPGANKGGNRTCEEVEVAFKADFAFCGTKLNYGDSNSDGQFEFDGSFPDGLNVVVDGNNISFSADECILIDGVYCKVGAVIVKGAASANVYFYGKGTLSDSLLAAPGGEHMVSNLTFCFVECSIVAVKIYYTRGEDFEQNPGSYSAAQSFGKKIFTSTDWCKDLGINDFTPGTTFALIDNYYKDQIGTVTLTQDYTSTKVLINLSGNATVDNTWLFVGTEDALIATANGGCPDYRNKWTLFTDNGNTLTFTIPD